MNDDADAINKIEAELGINPSGVYTDVVTRLNTLETISFNAQAGTSYTLVLGDASKCVQMNSSSANTLVIPLNASVAFPVGTQIMVRQDGTGKTTVQGTGGVTLNNPYSLFSMKAQHASAILIKTATNTWSLNGEVAA